MKAFVVSSGDGADRPWGWIVAETAHQIEAAFHGIVIHDPPPDWATPSSWMILALTKWKGRLIRGSKSCGARDFAADTGGIILGKGPMKHALHFVGFKDPRLEKSERSYRAVRVFGWPDFYHRGWDCRARREIMDGDTIVFANRDWRQEPRIHSYDDSAAL
ncbi:MAG TPA: hypothetical protein VGH23_00675 [Rhizomicrobium sp.]